MVYRYTSDNNHHKLSIFTTITMITVVESIHLLHSNIQISSSGPSKMPWRQRFSRSPPVQDSFWSFFSPGSRVFGSQYSKPICQGKWCVSAIFGECCRLFIQETWLKSVSIHSGESRERGPNEIVFYWMAESTLIQWCTDHSQSLTCFFTIRMKPLPSPTRI